MSTERLIVHEAVSEAFLDKLVAKILSISVGDPDDSETTFSYLESIDLAQRIKLLVEDAVSKGATVHDEAQAPFGGAKASGYGRFGSKSASEAFTEMRWITFQTTSRNYPL